MRMAGLRELDQPQACARRPSATARGAWPRYSLSGLRRARQLCGLATLPGGRTSCCARTKRELMSCMIGQPGPAKTFTINRHGGTIRHRQRHPPAAAELDLGRNLRHHLPLALRAQSCGGNARPLRHLGRRPRTADRLRRLAERHQRQRLPGHRDRHHGHYRLFSSLNLGLTAHPVHWETATARQLPSRLAIYPVSRRRLLNARD